MRVHSLRRPTSEPRAGAASRSGDGNSAFRPAAPAAARSAVISGTGATTAVASLLCLQNLEEPGARAKRVIGQGRLVLDILDDLKVAFLSGAVGRDNIMRLEEALARREHYAGDERLKDLLDQIDLRAQVELAKLRKAAA